MSGQTPLSDLVDLNDIGSNDTWPELVDPIAVRIAPSGGSFRPSQSSKVIWLPPREEAECLFEIYADRVEHLQHVLHIPTVRSHLADLYDFILKRRVVDYSHVALVLCIIASTTFYWTPVERGESLAWSAQNASQISVYWVKAALDVLDYLRRIGSCTLVDVQCYTILFFLMYNTEGMSARACIVGFNSISIARELRLHRLDINEKDANSTTSTSDVIIAEVKRRIWWYLASSDWYVLHAAIR